MADYRYGNERSRSSIFSDDDNDRSRSSERSRWGRDEERGRDRDREQGRGGRDAVSYTHLTLPTTERV